jgi:hypothetical protein
MDPITAIAVAALTAYSETVKAIAAFQTGATPEQKVQMIQNWLDTEKWWRDLFTKLKIGG